MNESIEILKDYLLSNIIKDKHNIESDEPIISSGLVDSFGMLDLVFFIREQFGVSMEEYEIPDNHVDTLDDLAELIHSKM